MSLTSCIAKAGEYIRPDDKAAIFTRARELRQGGMDNDTAAKQAVREQLELVRSRLVIPGTGPVDYMNTYGGFATSEEFEANRAQDRQHSERMGAAWRRSSNVESEAAGYTPERTAQTDTPEFKQWFGKSKVVDENGKPRVMYHGSYRDFDTFDRDITKQWRQPSMDTIGSWFSDEPGEGGAGIYAAGEDARIYPVYLRIEKPKVYPTFQAFLNDMHRSAGRDPKKQNPIGRGSADEVRAKLQAQGYDGIKFNRTDNQELYDELTELRKQIDRERDPEYRAEYEAEYKRLRKKYEASGGGTELDNQTVWIAFEPAQIKSAIGNRGTFDPADPSMVNTEAAGYTPEDTTRPVRTRKVPEAPRGRDDLRPDVQAAIERVFGRVDRRTQLQKLTDAFHNPNGIMAGVREYLHDLAERVIQGMLDEYRPIKTRLSAEAYRLARLSTSGNGSLSAQMYFGKIITNEDGSPDVVVDERGGFIKQITDLVGPEVQEFLKWVAAHRAQQLMAEGEKFLLPGETRSGLAQAIEEERAKPEPDEKAIREMERRLEASFGREHLMSEQDVAALLTMSEGTMRDGANRAERYQQALDVLTEFNSAVLDRGVAAGLVAKSWADKVRQDPYLPFYRQWEQGDEDSPPMYGASLTGQSMGERLRGGTELLNDDLLGNVLHNWSHMFTASAKNMAGNQALTEMESLGLATRLGDKREKGAKWTMQGGQPVYWMVHDTALAASISAMHYTMPEWQRPLANFKTILTLGVTTLPAFKVRNTFRDTMQAVAVSEGLSANPATNLAEGAKVMDMKGAMQNMLDAARGKAPLHFFAQNQDFATMLASGGIMHMGSLFEGNDAAEANAAVRRANRGIAGTDLLADSNNMGRLVNYMKGLGEAYTSLMDTGEQINRAAIFRRLREQGASVGEAAFQARDLMDFSLRGSWPVVRFLAQTVPFLNARLQGLYKLGRAATSGEKYDAIGVNKRFANVAGSVVMASLALWLLYRDDEDWKQREDWDRDTYWWFKIGDAKFRIPKPFEVGSIGTIAERTAEWMFERDMTDRRFYDRLAHMAMSTFAFNPTPQFAKPLIDVYANKDSFTGRAIEGELMRAQRVEDRYDPSTSMFARGLGQLGIPNPLALVAGNTKEKLSPAQIDYLLQGYFGGVASLLTGATDMLARPLAGEGVTPSWKLKQITNTLVGLPVETGKPNTSRYTQLFYDRAEDVSRAYQSYYRAVQVGDVEKAKALAEEFPEKIRENKMLQQQRQRLAAITAQMQRVNASKSLSAETKRTQLDQLTQARNALTRQIDSVLEPY